MRQHVLHVIHGASSFASLIAAVRDAGERAGWLELAPPSRRPEELDAAAEAGALRAVAVGGGQSVAVKPMRGEPVLRDLLREHFRGCALVLVRGDASPSAVRDPRSPLPRLEPDGSDWLLHTPDGARRRLTTPALLRKLAKPRLWKETTS